MNEHCLYHSGKLQAQGYQGDECEWNREHWWGWCSEKFIEHVRGEVFWMQFDHAAYSLLTRHDNVAKRYHSQLSVYRDWRYEFMKKESKTSVAKLTGVINHILKDLAQAPAAERMAGAGE